MSLKGFNLLQGNVAPPDAWDNVYDWVNQVGRVIVIVVEIAVIASFVARVVVDTQAKNLLEEERQNSTRLTALRPSEIRYRDQQDKFEAYKQVWNESSAYAPVIRAVTENAPRSVTELTLVTRGEIINVSGVAATREISTFENALKSNATIFADVIVSEIEAIAPGAAGDTGAAQGSLSNFTIQINIRSAALDSRPDIGVVGVGGDQAAQQLTGTEN